MVTRILIDAIPIREGGGTTHLVSLLPELDRLAEDMCIYVLTGPEQWKVLENRYNHIHWIDCGKKPDSSL